MISCLSCLNEARYLLHIHAFPFDRRKTVSLLAHAPADVHRFKIPNEQMFSGIVEELGRVLAMDKDDSMLLWDGTLGEGYVLKIRCEKVLKDAYLG